MEGTVAKSSKHIFRKLFTLPLAKMLKYIPELSPKIIAKLIDNTININVPTIAGKIPSKTLCLSKIASNTLVSEKIISKEILLTPLKITNNKRRYTKLIAKKLNTRNSNLKKVYFTILP